jgi:hypothetical protein
MNLILKFKMFVRNYDVKNISVMFIGLPVFRIGKLKDPGNGLVLDKQTVWDCVQCGLTSGEGPREEYDPGHQCLHSVPGALCRGTHQC